MMIRYTRTFLVVMMFAIHWLVEAKTNLYFVNKTAYTLNVTYSSGTDPKGADLNDFVTGPASVAPNQRVQLMSVPRGGMALDPSVNYFFNAFVGGLPGSKQVGLSLLVRTSPIHGVGKTSSIKATSYVVGEDATWYDAGVTRTFSSEQKLGGKLFTLNFKWLGTGGIDIYEDIEYVLTETGTISDPKKLILLQYNIQQRPPYEGLKYTTLGMHGERSFLSTVAMPQAIKQFNADVVAVNEAFTAALRGPLKEEMKKNGYLYSTDVLGSKGKALWSGGVLVFSKYPFTRTAELIYKNFASADKNADKGALYVQIKKAGVPYNIFATHTNASYDFGGKVRLPMTDVGRTARAKQFAELADFIKAQNIPANEPVVIVGDMNVDMLSEKGQSGDEYQYMLSTLNATHPELVGPNYTFSFQANEWVDPNDGPVQLLDYALLSKGYLQPKKSFNKTICLKSSGADMCTKGSGAHRDLSDHFPLLAEFSF